MSELEDIGRYHQAIDLLKAALNQRDQRLQRIAYMASEASKAPVSRYKTGKVARLTSMRRLLDEAEGYEGEVQQLLAELSQLGPAIGKPVPELE